MDDLLERLRQRGWRLTAQRRVVAEALAGDNLHLTADEVHERAQIRLPEISRATVYNTLNELVSMGEVAVVVPDGRANRYDPNVVHAHHHLLCTVCGTLDDVGADHADLVEATGVAAEGWSITDIDITFRGRCRHCR